MGPGVSELEAEVYRSLRRLRFFAERMTVARRSRTG
jgi:hypothetical protein